MTVAQPRPHCAPGQGRGRGGQRPGVVRIEVCRQGIEEGSFLAQHLGLAGEHGGHVALGHVVEEGQQLVRINNETFMLSVDGYLMPTRKDQPPPDLRYFKQTAKTQ